MHGSLLLQLLILLVVANGMAVAAKEAFLGLSNNAPTKKIEPAMIASIPIR